MSDKTTDMQIQTVDINNLVIDPQNARKHSERQLNAIASSLKEFGQRRPIVITSDNVIVAGNGTYTAAKRLGWKAISVTVLPFKDKSKTRAFAIADNRTSDLASWDDDMLLDALVELQGNDLLEAAGYTAIEVDDLRALLGEDKNEDMHNMNTETTSNIDDLIARYESRATRSVVFDYPNDVYIWFVDNLGIIREQMGAASNAQAAVALIGEYLQKEAPLWNIE